MSSARVAVAECRRSAVAEPIDLYPDPDSGPLLAALRSADAIPALVSWDDPRVVWGSFGHVLISGTWDSVDRPDEYLAWVRQVESETTVANPVAVIEWGLDKRYQRQLAAAGVPVIPTMWVEPGERWLVPEGEFVVKPAVSGGGRSTARYRPGDPAAAAHLAALHEAGQTVMVQPYLSPIELDGEIDRVYLAGEFSHAVAKRPLLRAGEGVVERPWERIAWDGLVTPRQDALAVAEKTIESVSTLCGVTPCYGRIDIVRGERDEPLVIEVEVVDPYLSLDLYPRAARRLVAELLR